MNQIYPTNNIYPIYNADDNIRSIYIELIKRLFLGQKKEHTKQISKTMNPEIQSNPLQDVEFNFQNCKFAIQKTKVMSIIKTVRGFTPKYGSNCFFAENSVIVGDVVMGNDCSIWFNAVLRGDVNSIRIGNRVNIQDGAVLHTLYQKSTIEIGDNVSIGHNVTIHGAKISNNVLVGIGATVLDDAEIGENVIIAANALILSGTKVEPNSVWAGVPAKKVKDIAPEQTAEMINKIANNYLMYASWYKEEE